jgi:hypothetical protein
MREQSSDISQRVAIQCAVGKRADELRFSIDPADMPQTACERTTRLAASLGCIAATDDDERDHYLVEHAADVLIWLEDRAREQAA